MPVNKSSLPADPTCGYFLYLPDIKVTVNLTQIAYVEWTIVADPKIDPMFISTVTLSGGGGFYLTKEGSELLWEALQVFNQRQVQPGIALNRIYDLLFWLNNNNNNQQQVETNEREYARERERDKNKETPSTSATTSGTNRAEDKINTANNKITQGVLS